MAKEDEEKTSFITPFETFCFVRMPEGLKNAGSTLPCRGRETMLLNEMNFSAAFLLVITARRPQGNIPSTETWPVFCTR
jgi:hypothetical protein